MHAYSDLPARSLVGGHIAFTGMAEGAREGYVWMVDRDGAEITYLAHSRAVTPNDGAPAQWSHEGRQALYARDAGGTARLCAIDA